MTSDIEKPASAEPFAVEGEWLGRLGDGALVRIVRQLLRAGAGRHGLPILSAHASSHLDAPGGGEDVWIRWEGGPIAY